MTSFARARALSALDGLSELPMPGNVALRCAMRPALVVEWTEPLRPPNVDCSWVFPSRFPTVFRFETVHHGRL